MPKSFRTVAAALIIAIATTLAGATPSHANLFPRHRAFEDSGLTEPSLRSFLVTLLVDLFCDAGGAMDPNGLH